MTTNSTGLYPKEIYIMIKESTVTLLDPSLGIMGTNNEIEKVLWVANLAERSGNLWAQGMGPIEVV